MWGPGAQGGFQNALAMGLQMGQMAGQAKRERDERNALAAYAKDPNEENFGGLADVRPDIAIQMRGQQARQQGEAAQQRRADLPLVTRLLETANDQESYTRNIAVAQQYGIDTSTLPPQFDPAWRDQTLMTMKALQSPEAQQALSTIGKEVADMGYQPGTPEFSAKVSELWTTSQSKTIPYQPGGNVINYNPVTGEATPLVQGQTPQGAAPTAPPPPGTIEDGYRYKGGNPSDPKNWEPVAGGAGGNVSGNFPGP